MTFDEVAQKHELRADELQGKNTPIRYYTYKQNGDAFTINVKRDSNWWHAHKDNKTIKLGAGPEELDKFLTAVDKGKKKIPKAKEKKVSYPDLSTRRKKIQPQSHVKYHKDWQHDPIRYMVLAVEQLTTEEKEKVRAVIKTLTSGTEAQQFVHHDQSSLGGKKGFEVGWSYTLVDRTGRTGILSYKGVEVAVYYERQKVAIEPAAEDPIPETVLKDPSDTWQRLDLIGPSAREANRFLKQRVEVTSSLAELNARRVRTLESLKLYYERTVKRLERQLVTQKELVSVRKGRRPDKQRALGQMDVLQLLGGISAQLVNLRMAYDEEHPTYKKLIAMRAQLQKVGSQFKCQFIVPKKGEKFNPKLEEVIRTTERADPGVIYEVVEHGLVVDGKLLQPAKVIIGGKK